MKWRLGVLCVLLAALTLGSGCIFDPTDDGFGTADDAGGDPNNGINNDFNNDENNDVGNNDFNNDGNNDPNNNPNNEPPQLFTLVLIQDLAQAVVDGTPGADIDAVGLIKAEDGTELFAAVLQAESNVPCDAEEGGAINEACDPLALLGAPDAVNEGECFGGGDVDTTLFTSLNQGFVIVSFGDDEVGAEAAVIENGDAIHVYELGATECGRFDDDTVTVSVGVSDQDLGAFIEMGTTVAGDNIIEVSGLP